MEQDTHIHEEIIRLRYYKMGMYKRLCKKIQKISLVLLGMSTKAVSIPRGEATLGARAIFHFCACSLRMCSISCSMVSGIVCSHDGTFENSNA